RPRRWPEKGPGPNESPARCGGGRSCKCSTTPASPTPPSTAGLGIERPRARKGAWSRPESRADPPGKGDMKQFIKRWSALLLLPPLGSGCTQAAPPAGLAVAPSPVTYTEAQKAKYLLPEEPAGAQAVIPAREQVQDGDEVVVFGRVGGRFHAIV